MNPGDVRTFKKGKQLALVVALGVWAERSGEGRPIHIHLTGPYPFHTTVTNQKGSVRYHRTLFRNLKQVLVAHSRWPFSE